MPEQNDEFARKLRATFKVEAEEHLQAMSSMLLDLEKSPESAVAAGKIEQIYREAHSLKGAARAVDQYDVETICQALESVFAGWKRGTTAPSPEEFDVFHDSLDTIRTLLAAPAQAGEGGRQKHADLLQRLKQVGAKQPSGGDRAAAPIQVSQPEVVSRDSFSQPEAAGRAPSMDPVITDGAVAIPETVRISTAKLDARLLQAEELLTVKASLAQRAADLRELAGSFDQWRKEWSRVSADVRVMRRQLEDRASNGSERLTHASTALMEFLDWNGDYLRSIESRITNLSSSAEQDRRGIGKQVDELLEDSKKLLMLPFSDLAAILPKVVRDLARDQGKDVDLVVRGGEIEIDKRILEEIKDPLIHLLRNSVDHGIEKPAERIRGQKPARATITLTASRVNGSKVEIEVADDGAGIDLERVKESAIRHGILAPQVARGLSDADAIGLIFRSEITTSPIVTEISGRGLGMTIVRANTEKLGGSVSVQSSRHKGTTLQMVLPITVATFRGVLVSSAGQVFVVPTTHIERVLRVKRDQIHTVENREAISLNGGLVSLARLDRVLEIPPKPDPAADSSPLPVLVLHANDERLAFAVDQVLREEEVLVKPLRKPLVRVRNIAGATVLGSGKAVAVLQVSDLIKSARVGGAAASAPIVPATDSSAPSKRVLVVEDSITSRMLLKGILESAGYEVRTAVDGMEAFTILREDQFDLVVSDVEMPRLNGFDLTARIRADIRLSEMPVILVTALESREERERGIDAGANAYIIKSSFDQSNLLEVARSLA